MVLCHSVVRTRLLQHPVRSPYHYTTLYPLLYISVKICVLISSFIVCSHKMMYNKNIHHTIFFRKTNTIPYLNSVSFKFNRDSNQAPPSQCADAVPLSHIVVGNVEIHVYIQDFVSNNLLSKSFHTVFPSQILNTSRFCYWSAIF